MSRLPSPEDFFGNSPPPRIIGTETEVDVQLPFDGSLPYIMDSYYGYISHDAVRKAGYDIRNDYLDNGMKLYLTGELTEICSAESLGPLDAVESDRAALAVLSDVVTASGMPYEGIFCYSATTKAVKTNSVGRHENYLIPRNLPEPKFFNPVMASTLASRIINFCGTIGPDGFLLSQKAQAVEDPAIINGLSRTSQHGDKPMAVVTRPKFDDTVPTDGNWKRFEVRMCDVNRSDLASYLGMAVVSLSLRLIEHPRIVDLKTLARWSFHRPAQAAKQFSSDLSLSRTVRTQEAGIRISAVDYNELLLDQYRKLAERIVLPLDEAMAIPMLGRVNDELRKADLVRGEYGELPEMLDFAARHRWLAERYGPHRLSTFYPDADSDRTVSNDKVLAANILFDRILPAGGGSRYWATRQKHVVSFAAVQARKHTPPTTRAAARSRLIRQPGESPTVSGWDTVAGSKIYVLSHPYDPDPAPYAVPPTSTPDIKGPRGIPAHPRAAYPRNAA